MERDKSTKENSLDSDDEISSSPVFRPASWISYFLAVLFLHLPIGLFLYKGIYHGGHPFVDIVVMTYNGLFPGLFLAIIFMGFCLTLNILIQWIYKIKIEASFLKKLWLFEISIISVAALFISFMFFSTAPLVLAFYLTLLYWAAFFLEKPKLPAWSKWGAFPFLLLAAFSNFLLAPAIAAFFLMLTNRRLNKGRALHLLLWATALLIISIVFLSNRPIALSSSASKLLNFPNLYDCQIDKWERKMLVSTKRYEDGGGLIFSFNLDDLKTSFSQSIIPTVELENFALDGKNKKIYHLNRNDWDYDTNRQINRYKRNLPLLLLVIDADSFNVIRTGEIFETCTGSANHALLPASARLLINCEEDYLYTINLDTLVAEKSLYLGRYVDILGDNEKGVVYLNYNMKKILETRDPESLELIRTSPGPILSDKMVLAPFREELYVPAGLESQVWVYSTKELKLLRKIQTQFGQRALAVDEKNNLLVAASGITGFIHVIDLATGEKLQSHYVAKYGRTIALDVKQRHAFITTTHDGLFLLKY